MHTSVVNGTINRSNRNLLIIALVALLALVVFAALTFRYYANFFAGPSAISQADLLGAQDADDLFQYYVTVEGDDVADTGFTLETTRNGVVTSTKNYLGLLVGDKVLLIETAKMAIGTAFTGSLIDIPGDVQREVVDVLVKDEPDLKGIFLPMMLRDDDFNFSGYLGIALTIGLAALAGWNLFRGLTRMSDPSRHPIMRALSRFGDPRMVVGDLDAQLAVDHPKVGNVHITPNWMVHTQKSDLNATRFDDIVWIYKQVTQHRTNGIPTGKTFTAQIYDRHGAQIVVQGKEDLINQTLNAILQRAPWAIAGHSSELEKAWKSNRAALVAAADHRRQQVLAS